jgi:hypothetical protein
MADITPSRKLFDLLISRDFDPEMLDSSGRPAPDPSEAEIFSFDFRATSGKDYGTVVIMLGQDNNLEIYCSDNVGRSMEGDDKNDWFAFLEQLKNFSVRNFMSFGIKNLNRLRYSMQGQAAIREGLFESWTGNRTTSWNGEATEARLMIRHKKTIGEGDARFRYIESLFIETADSERYRLPFKSLTGGKAMLEHVRQGGRPYDVRGNHISEMVTELAVLSRFRRANTGQIFEDDTAQLVEQVEAYQTNLQRSLKGLSTQSGYAAYFESWQSAEISEQDVVIESLKNLFVKQSIDTRIESALPLLAKIQQQGNEMKEANIFEAWANRLVEGTWATPDTPEKQAQLVELMSAELPVGADATNATEQLYDLIGDDELVDQLQALAEQDANADARPIIYDRMQQLSADPDIAKVMTQLTTSPDNPAEPVNESRLMDSAGETIEHVLNRFKHEVKQFEQSGELDQDLYEALFDYYSDAGEIPYGIAKARDGDPMEWVAQNLQSHLSGGGIVGGMPDEDYGMERESVGDYAEEKSRISKLAGLPPKETDEGILGTLGGAGLGMALGGPVGAAIGAVGGQEMTKGGSSIIEQGEEETDEGWKGQLAGGTVGTLAGTAAGSALGPVGAIVGGALGGTAGQMVGDKLGGNEEETDEGKLGAVAGGAIGGYATKSVKGAMSGAKIGSALQDRFAKKDDTSPLAGQYGHSGKMKEVSKDMSFLDRLKELSGMKK